MRINNYLSGLVAVFFLGPFVLASSCNSSASGPATVTAGSQRLEDRATVDTQAVANYQEKIQDKLNNWYFSVRLYETKNPLDYVVNMGYEEVADQDTIHFPDLGYPIKPAIQKAADSLSCYIGFTDPKGNFMYFKGVWVDKNGLNIRTVRSYAKGSGAQGSPAQGSAAQ
jgi:hypothetical protein